MECLSKTNTDQSSVRRKKSILAVLFLYFQLLHSVFAQSYIEYSETEAPSSAPAANLDFMDYYLAKCGGKYYSNCDTIDINQATIFNDAKNKAKKEKSIIKN